MDTPRGRSSIWTGGPALTQRSRLGFLEAMTSGFHGPVPGGGGATVPWELTVPGHPFWPTPTTRPPQAPLQWEASAASPEPTPVSVKRGPGSAWLHGGLPPQQTWPGPTGEREAAGKGEYYMPTGNPVKRDAKRGGVVATDSLQTPFMLGKGFKCMSKSRGRLRPRDLCLLLKKVAL